MADTAVFDLDLDLGAFASAGGWSVLMLLARCLQRGKTGMASGLRGVRIYSPMASDAGQMVFRALECWLIRMVFRMSAWGRCLRSIRPVCGRLVAMTWSPGVCEYAPDSRLYRETQYQGGGRLEVAGASVVGGGLRKDD